MLIQYPAYALGVADIHLRSGMTLLAPKPPFITEVSDSPAVSKPLVDEPVDLTNVTIPILVQPVVEPPFPDQLIQKKPKQRKEQPFDIVLDYGKSRF